MAPARYDQHGHGSEGRSRGDTEEVGAGQGIPGHCLGDGTCRGQTGADDDGGHHPRCAELGDGQVDPGTGGVAQERPEYVRVGQRSSAERNVQGHRGYQCAGQYPSDHKDPQIEADGYGAQAQDPEGGSAGPGGWARGTLSGRVQCGGHRVASRRRRAR